MARVVVAAGMALALLADPGHAQTPSEAPDPKAKELAEAIVAADGDRARASALSSMELGLTVQIENSLEPIASVKKDSIAGIVHRSVQTLEDDLVEARVSAMAQTYTIEELKGYLDFENSPAGQALRGAAPELNRSLMSVLGPDAPVPDGPPSSEQKLALINRILTARDIEPSARKGWRVLNATMMNAFSDIAKNAAPPGAIKSDQVAENAYAKRVVTAETQFYSKNFSDEQLAEMAAFFDGPTGRAFVRRAPQLSSIVASAVPGIFDRQFERMDREACAAVDCSADQRAALNARLGQVRSIIALGANAMAH